MHPEPLLRRSFPLLLLGALVTATAAANDPWPRFRGPTGDGTAVADNRVPVQWAKDRNIRWRRQLPGQGWSSPVVGDGMIYLTAAVPDGSGENPDYDLSLLLVDPTTGRIVQTTKVLRQRAGDSPEIHSKNSHASPTPVLAEDRVYLHFGHQGSAAADRQGRVVWTSRRLAYDPVHGNGGSPLLVDDLLIAAYDGAKDPFVAALDAASGMVRWRIPRPVEANNKFSFSTPTAIEVEGKTQVIVPGSDCVTAHHPQDGHVLWYVRYDGYSVVPKPVFADGLVFISTGFGPTKVLAIRPTGRGDVTDTHVAWSLDRGAPKTPSMLADRGLLYVLSDDGILTVLETRTGTEVYRERIGGAYSASPVISGDKIFLVSESGKTTVVRAGRRFEKLAENDLGERVLASPAVVGPTIYLRTDAALYRIGE